jgi:mono/diheme cytochrome c family protein
MKTAPIPTNKILERAAILAVLTLAGIFTAGMAACSGPAKPQARSRGEAASAPASSATTASSSVPSAGATTPAEKGKQFFDETCSSCHGQNGEGVPHLGADLRTDKVVAKSTDAQLVALIEHGIPASDSRNKSHVPMPPKGANPALTKQSIEDIVLYIRQLETTHLERK